MRSSIFDNMKALLINIGNELLLGRTINTNAARLALILNPVGVEVIEARAIADTQEALFGALNHLPEGIDCIIITGGLGPTPDDLTTSIIAEFYQEELILFPEAEEHMKSYFGDRWATLRDINIKQAHFPASARLLDNPNGTAMGFSIQQDGIQVFCTPGVPKECLAMVQDQVVPILQESQSQVLVQSEFYTYGLGESLQTELFQGFYIPNHIQFASLPSRSGLLVRLSAWADSTQAKQVNQVESLQAEVDQYSQMLRDLVQHSYPQTLIGAHPLLPTVETFLKSTGLKISVAESCTSGLLGYYLTETPGSSTWFVGGVQAYSNQVKQSTLQVRPESLDQYGAVSEEVAQEMAVGVAQLLDTDLALSITGIAGPDGGTPDKPVGTVCFAIYYQGELFSETKRLRGGRQEVRERSVWQALDLLRRTCNPH